MQVKKLLSSNFILFFHLLFAIYTFSSFIHFSSIVFFWFTYECTKKNIIDLNLFNLSHNFLSIFWTLVKCMYEIIIKFLFFISCVYLCTCCCPLPPLPSPSSSFIYLVYFLLVRLACWFFSVFVVILRSVPTLTSP